MTCQLYTFQTQLGWFALAIDDGLVRQLAMAHRTAAAARRTLRPELVAEAVNRLDGPVPELVERIRSYAAGEPEDFRDIKVDTSYLTPLGRTVMGRCRRIPYGQTRTYGQLAAEVGRGGAARAVGCFMAANRTPLVVPCHRVVAADGRLGGFSAPGGIGLKKKLLQIESLAAG